MEKSNNKPRLVFFQWKHEGLPAFLKWHLLLHVKCLSEFFDVILIRNDCDYQQICDTYQPDLTLFESGYKSTISKRLNIKNPCAYPEIPKLGFHNGDGWCECRTGFFSDMDRWGIDTFFSISTTTAEYTPAIAEKLYIWPNFIDSDSCRDYNQPKTVPVLLNGSTISLYPWRQKVYKAISEQYQTLSLPHLGYQNHSSKMIHGEQYARTINTAWFTPACGTITKEVVRKHFEIPGSKSCLITERTLSIEAAGFMDMQNCVFADDSDVLDKLNYLFKNMDELEQIITAGYNLVHARHTLKQRDQIFQWFNLYKGIQPNQKIIQEGPFEPLRVVEISSGFKNNHIISEGVIAALLRQGDEKLWEGKYDQAEVLYLECLKFIAWMSEPKLKLAILNLFKGKPDEALQWIIEPIQNILGSYNYSDPDPVEWAYFVIALLCKGDLKGAVIRANQFPLLYHPELDRVRWVIDLLRNNEYKNAVSQNRLANARQSIHQLPQLVFFDWIRKLCVMLKACDQVEIANVVNGFVASTESWPGNKTNRNNNEQRLVNNFLLNLRIICIIKMNYLFKVFRIPNRKTGLPSIYAIDYMIRLGKWVKIDAVKKLILGFRP